MNTGYQAPNEEPRELPRLAVVAIFRNEAPYVVEWLAHHRVVGVHSFYIADNISDDGTSELLQALHELGYLQRIPFPSPPGQPPQLLAYAEVLGSHAADEEWVAVIDADEFIVPKDEPYNARACLSQLAAQPDVGAVVLNWAIYGSSWLANHAAGLVTERFIRRAHPSFEPNLHYKTIVRMAAYAGLTKNPHHFELKPGWRHVHTNGQEVVFHERHGPGLSQEVVWASMRLNHYIVKSREEFTTRKQRNGSAASLTRVKDERYFRAHDRNDARDPVPSTLISRVREEVQRIEEALKRVGPVVVPASRAAPCYFAPFARTHGHVDGVECTEHGIQVRGWAFSPLGTPAGPLVVKAGEATFTFETYERVPRPDVQSHYPMVQPNCGFHLVVPRDGLKGEPGRIDVFATEATGELSGPFPFPGRRG